MQTPENPPEQPGPKKRRRLRAQVTDPLTGRRVNVYSDDAGGLEHRKSRIRGTRDDLKAGVISKQEAAQILRPLRSGPLTVGAAFERYLATQSEDTAPIARANWKSRLRFWFGELAPVELSREKMAAWEAALIRRGDASKTIKNSYDHLAACCRMLVDSGELDALPWGDRSRHQGGSGWRPSKVIPKKQRRAAATVEQLAAFLAIARADDMTHWERGEYADRYILLIVLFLVGLRQAEACALSWNLLSLDTEPALLRIAYQAKRGWRKRTPEGQPRQPTKTRSERSHNLHPSVVEALRFQRAELVRRGWYREDGPVFPGRGGEFRTSGSVIKPARMRDYAKAAGFPFWQDWVTHSTKHSFATLEVIASGGDLKRTQARTGHADVRQLEGYLHDAGQFLGRSAIPPLEVTAPVVALLPGGEGEIVAADGSWPKVLPRLAARLSDVPGDPWGIEQVPAAPDLQAVDLRRANDWGAARREQKAKERQSADRPFIAIAREWIASGAKTKSGYPPEVIRKGDLAAVRNYRQAERRHLPKEKCQQAARHARHCVKGAWTRELKKALANPPKPPVPPEKSPQ